MDAERTNPPSLSEVLTAPQRPQFQDAYEVYFPDIGAPGVTYSEASGAYSSNINALFTRQSTWPSAANAPNPL